MLGTGYPLSLRKRWRRKSLPCTRRAWGTPLRRRTVLSHEGQNRCVLERARPEPVLWHLGPSRLTQTSLSVETLVAAIEMATTSAPCGGKSKVIFVKRLSEIIVVILFRLLLVA